MLELIEQLGVIGWSVIAVVVLFIVIVSFIDHQPNAAKQNLRRRRQTQSDAGVNDADSPNKADAPD
jgi:hypothetical protein